MRARYEEACDILLFFCVMFCFVLPCFSLFYVFCYIRFLFYFFTKISGKNTGRRKITENGLLRGGGGQGISGNKKSVR